jgi:hypothetical protein
MGLLDGLLGTVGGLLPDADVATGTAVDVSVAGVDLGLDLGATLGVHPELPDLGGLLG